MEYEILLSIIIPMYNSEKHITQCVESCYEQGLEENDFEIVIIDDGSTDNSASIVNDMLNLHANMQISSELRKCYLQVSNSIVVSNFLLLFSQASPFCSKREFFKLAFDYNIFPLKGKTRFWRFTLIVPLTNIVAMTYNTSTLPITML